MKEKSQKIKQILAFAVFLFLLSFPVTSDSLWDDGFEGYLSQSYPYKTGETLLVIIDSDYQFSLSSSSKDNKLLNLEFKGGGYGDLFSFLPAVKSSGSGVMDRAEEISLTTQLPVEIVAIDQNNVAQISGQRRISVDGRDETVSLSGSVFLKDVAKDRSVVIERVNNARLSYSSLLMPSFETISDADLQEVAMEILGDPAMEGEPVDTEAMDTNEAGPDEAIPAEPEGAEGAVAGVTEPDQGQPTATPKPEFQLDEARQKELFLIYVNRLVDVLFSQAQ